MRKTFKLFCAAALAALAVSSCGKIWDEFDNVHGEIDGLEARIAELETKLNDQVATINTTLGALADADKKLAADIAALVKDVDAAQALLEKLDAADGTINGKIDDLAKALAEFETENEKALAEIVAKIAVVKVEKNKAGNVVLTFADGSTLEVAAADPNANNAGLVTVVDGKWAVVGADGKTTVLDAELHPDTKIDFKIAENTLFVSYDGGKTWEKTDVVVNDETTINIVEDFEYTEGDAFVTITVGGKAYVLPLYEADNSSLVLTNNNFYLRYTATKTVELTAEDISEYYVMSKPDGWKATLDGTTLTVVAPSKDAVEFGAAEEVGEILIHATTSSGLCKVAKIDVTTGPGLTLSVDTKGNIVIKNSYIGEWSQYGPMGMEKGYGFLNFYLGLASDEFIEDVDAFMTFVEEEYFTPDESPCIQGVYGQYFERGEFVENKYETDVLETSIAEILDGDANYGDRYIVWVAPADDMGKVIPTEVAYVDFTNFIVEVKATSVSSKDITVSLNAKGADAYAIGMIAERYYAGADNPMTFEEFMNDKMLGPWNNFINYGQARALNMFYTETDDMHTDETLPATLNLSELNYGDDLAFGETYMVWVMPMFDHKAILDETQSEPEYDYYVYDYSAYDFNKDFMPYVFEFKTKDLEAGGSYKATLGEPTVGYNFIEVPVTLSEGTTKAYYKWYTVDEFNEFANDAELRADLFTDCDWPMEYDEVLTKDYIGHSEDWMLAIVSIGDDAKYGDLVTKKYSTLSITKNENISVTLDKVVAIGDYEYEATFSVSGATKFVGFNAYVNRDAAEEAIALRGYEAEIAEYLGRGSDYVWSDVVDGKVTVTFDAWYDGFYAWGYNVDEDGELVDFQASPLLFSIEDNLSDAE